MDDQLSRSGDVSIQRHLDRAEVLRSTMEQLCKDLSLSCDDLNAPAEVDTAFEGLREQVLPVLQQLDSQGEHALKVAMYRVDIPEPHFRRTLASGGLHALAGQVVLRALQKVLTRLRYAGSF
ncbi:MAG: hypothetical protein JNM62_16495 [Flavobacteriales bacterium]|nr:hypothetical protein [Flavobacteriales bacterium]